VFHHHDSCVYDVWCYYAHGEETIIILRYGDDDYDEYNNQHNKNNNNNNKNNDKKKYTSNTQWIPFCLRRRSLNDTIPAAGQRVTHYSFPHRFTTFFSGMRRDDGGGRSSLHATAVAAVAAVAAATTTMDVRITRVRSECID